MSSRAAFDRCPVKPDTRNPLAAVQIIMNLIGETVTWCRATVRGDGSRRMSCTAEAEQASECVLHPVTRGAEDEEKQEEARQDGQPGGWRADGAAVWHNSAEHFVHFQFHFIINVGKVTNKCLFICSAIFFACIDSFINLYIFFCLCSDAALLRPLLGLHQIVSLIVYYLCFWTMHFFFACFFFFFWPSVGFNTAPKWSAAVTALHSLTVLYVLS